MKYRRDLKALPCDNHKLYSGHSTRAEPYNSTGKFGLRRAKAPSAVQSTYWKVRPSRNRKKKNRRSDFLLRCKAVKWLVGYLGMKRRSTTLAGEGGSLRSNIRFLEPSEGSTFPATELLGQFPASLGAKEPLCNFTSGKYGAGRTALRRESPSALLLPPLV